MASVEGMKRFLTVCLSALAGATVGYVIHQIVDARRNGKPAEERRPLVVGAPLSNTVVAAIIGLISGKAGPVTAFASGLMSAMVAGNLDDVIPGLGTLRRDQIDKIIKAARPSGQDDAPAEEPQPQG